MSDHSFVVVDCETTGFHPSAHHRILELALVVVDETGQPADAWCTLLRPDRDLGPTDVHGIRGRDVLDAPTFDEVLGEVVDRLAGRVVVAHNARFDCAFLEHELARVGIDAAPLPALCTMELAALMGVGGGRVRLIDCCAAIGATISGEHTAEGDALACAALLAMYLSTADATGLSTLIRGTLTPADAWPRSERRAALRRRAHAVARTEPSFLAKLAQAADGPPSTNALQVAPYLDVLDRALEDRRLSPAEQEDLAATADMLGLDADRVRAVHADYVGTLIALAYRDGVVTDRERADLDLVADALGVDGVDDAVSRLSLRAAGSESIDADSGMAGKTVCFTGALICELEGQLVTRDLAHKLAERAGMVVQPGVTKKLDMLVVADPDSLSGKARKARDYGVRVVAENAFWAMIGVEVR